VAQGDRIIGTRVFGGYAITRKIGEGGMGAVYVAENRDLGKKLAIKVLLPDRSNNRNATARFLAEARAASAINHRNIIDIIDSSQLPDGRHYILMEYLDGTTLRRYARGIGPMPIDVVLAIMGQICSGLQAAHDRGIIHRDLKPSNIFLAPQPDNPYFAKILDFGIAKLDDPELAGDIHTKSHTVAGTPNYMSPEQARALRDVDHRADVYAIGVITYELLTGMLPYKAASIGDLTYKQASTIPAPVHQLRADLPRAWSDLVMRSIALEARDRTNSAAELARAMMAATPHGEAIARATASLLFAPPSGSSLSTRERRGSSVPPPSAEASRSRPLEARRSPSLPPLTATQSVGPLIDIDEVEPEPGPVDFAAPIGELSPNEEVTRAASPMALSKTHLPRIPEASAAASKTHSTSWPSPLSPAAPPPRRSSPVPVPAAVPPSESRDVPTTLGMSASQVGTSGGGSWAPWAWIVGGAALLAAIAGIAFVLSMRDNSGAAAPEIDAAADAATEFADAAPVDPTVTPLFDAAPPAIDAAAPEIDAAARDRDRTGVAGKRKGSSDDGAGSGAGSGSGSDVDLFKTRK
jgi:serine/threonine-protein kinase